MAEDAKVMPALKDQLPELEKTVKHKYVLVSRGSVFHCPLWVRERALRSCPALLDVCS